MGKYRFHRLPRVTEHPGDVIYIILPTIDYCILMIILPTLIIEMIFLLSIVRGGFLGLRILRSQDLFVCSPAVCCRYFILLLLPQKGYERMMHGLYTTTVQATCRKNQAQDNIMN